MISTLDLIRDDRHLVATLCLNQMSFEELVAENLARPFLHAQERAYYDALPQSPRRDSYLMGRLCAKQALMHHLDDQQMQAMLIGQGIFHQPVLQCPNIHGLQVSITHSKGLGGALVFDELHPMGIDIEPIGMQQSEAVDSQLTAAERALLPQSGLHAPGAALTWIWTVKEALAKALRTGLTVPLPLYAVSRIRHEDGFIVAEYDNFSQYKVMSFAWHGAMVSIALPKRTTLRMDFDIKGNLP